MKKLGVRDCICTIDAKKFMLVQVEDRYIYENGKKTDKTEGKNLTVICRDLQETNVLITVKTKDVEGLTANSANSFTPVAFEGLTVRPYIMNGKIELSVSAERAILKSKE